MLKLFQGISDNSQFGNHLTLSTTFCDTPKNPYQRPGT